MTTSSALQLADLALAWQRGNADLAILDLDLASDVGMETAVMMSLFTDRRAVDDDEPPSGDPDDRRGWWADEFSAVEGDRIGSRLWLLDRAKRIADTDLRAKEYVIEALNWMIEDGVVETLDVTVETSGANLLIAVTLQRPGREAQTLRFGHVWDEFDSAASVGTPPPSDPANGYPASATAMALAIPGGTFTHGWLCDDLAGDLIPVFGGVTLVASGTGLIYGDGGPRGGRDRSVGFTTGAATGRFSGSAALFDIASATDELIVAWVGKWSALPTAFGAMFGKATAAFGNGWEMAGRDGTSMTFSLGPSDLWGSSVLGTSAFMVGQWHVGIAVIDRSGADTARFGVRDLGGAVTVLSSGTTGINGNAAISASNFTVGRGDWVPGNDNFRLAALYVGKGTGVATGLAAGLSAALTTFQQRISGG